MYIVVRVGIFHTVTIEHKWVHSHLTIVNFCIFTKIKMLTYKKLGAKTCINIQTKMFCFFSEVIIGNGYLQVCVAIRANGHIRLFIVLKSTIQCVGFFHKALSVALIWNHNSLCTLSLSFMIIDVWSFKRLLQNTGTSTYFDCLVCTCQNK